MIKERAMELVEALRSGHYKQTRGQLRKDNAYCCLGVACDISKAGRWLVTDERSYLAGDAESAYVMPEEVRDHFGFKFETGDWDSSILDVDDPRADDVALKISALSALNDAGWSFTQIADFIEKNWEHL